MYYSPDSSLVGRSRVIILSRPLFVIGFVTTIRRPDSLPGHLLDLQDSFVFIAKGRPCWLRRLRLRECCGCRGYFATQLVVSPTYKFGILAAWSSFLVP